MTVSADIDEARADSLRSRRAAWRAFRSSPSGRVLLSAAVLLVVARTIVGEWGPHDLAVLCVLVLLIGPFEWVVHRYLLHASPDAWTSRRLGTGTGHREHHLDPNELRWLLLPGADAAIFLGMLMLLAVLWAPLVGLAVGGAPLASVVTAWLLTALALAHYEWVHLLIHTSYRMRSRYYRRLGRHHRWHHSRNEAHWLGVTSNLGDRMLGTYHSTAGAVPISGTARSLGASD